MNVGFILTPRMLTTGTAYPYEMWLAAKEMVLANKAKKQVNLYLVALSNESIKCRLPLKPDILINGAPKMDIIYLPALWRNPRKVLNQVPKKLDIWIKKNANQGSEIAAVGSGVSLLARTGLLDDKPATTHWHYFEEFSKQFPEINLKPDFFTTQCDKLHCAASINSLADVTVYLIEKYISVEIATHVERNFSHEIRRNYVSQRFSTDLESPSSDEVILEVKNYIQSNISNSISINAIARSKGISRRTLDRRFKNSTGITVGGYLQKQRISFAKDLLSQTDLPICEVAWNVGLHDPSYFAGLFKKEMLVRPNEYRKTVRAKLFSNN